VQAQQPTAGATGPSPQAVPEAKPPKPEPLKLDVAWKRDPFELPKPLERKAQETAVVPMRLTAIIDGRAGRVAVIDQQIVKQGDRIGQERVAGIGSDRVILTREGSQRVLTIGSVPVDKGEKESKESKGGGVK
jgi:hypothetical protein